MAATQWGVVARRQLAQAGLGKTTIDRRMANGRLIQLHRGVYAVGHRRLRREGHWLAAVLAVPGAVLSHRDAAGLHELRPANHHSNRQAFQHDREPDVRLQLAGYRVLRFTHDHVTRRPQHVAAAVREALGP